LTAAKARKCRGKSRHWLGTTDTFWGGFAVDATSAYWTASGDVFRVSLSGGTPIRLASRQHTLSALAVDGANVYWTNQGSVWNKDGYYEGEVVRVPITGGATAVFARQQVASGPIAVAGNNVYWSVTRDVASGSREASIVRLRSDACQAGVCR
jgi:organic radical activating enzyme